MNGLAHVALLLALAPSAPAGPKAEAVAASALSADSEASFRDSQPGCGEAKYCFGIALHIVTRDSIPAQTPAWLATQLEVANRHFAAIHTAFEIVSVEAMDTQFAHVATREQRDDIGRHKFGPSVVHLFLIEQLDDVDVPGEQIRGLHWRQRSNTAKRWVLLSRIAPDMVLAHELGHFFSLPHSTYAISIMNKRRRESPPRETRTFHAQEVLRMRKARNSMVNEGMLKKRARQRAEP